MLARTDAHIGQAWHVFVSEIKSEFKAEKGLNAIGFDTFIPVEKRMIVRCRKKLKVENPLFPRYGFVKFDSSVDNWPQVLETDGVEGILSNNQQPVRVLDHEISQLKLAEKFGLFDRTKKPMPFNPGDDVEIGEGPYAGMWGKVSKARSADRIKVLMQFFGSIREIEFDLLHLRAKS